MNTVREPKNVDANFGSADRWAQQVTADLRALGFNGLGNGNSPRLVAVRPPLVWVLRKDFMFAFAREKKLTAPAAGTQGFIDNCLPVFHPDFEPFCDHFGQGLTETAGDPWLLGIMTDNEVQCPVDLLDRCLAWKIGQPDLRPNRDAAAAWLTARHGSADAGRHHAARPLRVHRLCLRALLSPGQPGHPQVRPAPSLSWARGSTTTRASSTTPGSGKCWPPYHDVVSVNYYGYWGPDQRLLARWDAWCGKPILLTEWYAKAQDVPGLANTHGAGWLVHTQADRAAYYQHFALAALETPNIVGWHWFKYLDDPPESKALDNAGGANKGMFDVQGRPYQILADRAGPSTAKSTR